MQLTVNDRVLQHAPVRVAGQPERWTTRVLEAVREWHDRWAARRHLAEMDERLLRDIGLDRVEALREATKPFWRP